MKNWFRSNSQHLLIIVIFIALCFVYFSPAIQGKVLYQSDVMEAQAQSHEIMQVKAATGEGHYGPIPCTEGCHLSRYGQNIQETC
jgi:hypothetical protein